MADCDRRENGPATDALSLIRDVAPGQAVVLTDPNLEDNPIIFCTQTFSDLTGYAKEEIYGRNCRFLQGTETDQQTRRRLREAIAQAKEIEIEILNYRKDGSTFWQLLHISPIVSVSGKLRAFLGIHTPINGSSSIG